MWSLQPSTTVLATRKPLMDHLWAEEPTMPLFMYVFLAIYLVSFIH
jgi:hypothetical protein